MSQIADTYHCDPAAGPDARPSIGTVCPHCCVEIEILAAEVTTEHGAWVDVTWARNGVEHVATAYVDLESNAWAWDHEGDWPESHEGHEAIYRAMLACYRERLADRADARGIYRLDTIAAEVGQ